LAIAIYGIFSTHIEFCHSFFAIMPNIGIGFRFNSEKPRIWWAGSIYYISYLRRIL